MASARIALFLVAALTLPTHGVPVGNCIWSHGRLELSWKDLGAQADYYEVQISRTKDGNISAVFSTEDSAISLDFLESNTEYWIKIRAHNAGTPSLGPGTWQSTHAAVPCTTGATAARRIGPSPESNSFLLEVLRQSEYTYDVDYLMNHNSGDISGDTSFVTAASHDPDKPGFLNTTFRQSTFTLYCVEVLAVDVPGTITTDGNSKYADYLSCDDNHNATDPKCECDNSIDRFFSKASDQLKYCHNAKSGKACSKEQFHDCVCECTQTSLSASAKYTGMMPVYYQQPELLGHWYSHPKETECHEKENVGTRRPDGTQCTWKRYGEARVLRGGDALDAGWNFSSSGFGHSLDPRFVKQNAQVFRKVFDAQPYQQWSCASGRLEMHQQSVVV